DSRLRIDLAQKRLLCCSTGLMQAGSAPILVHPSCKENCVDRITVSDSLVEWLQNHNARALAAYIAIRIRVKRAALAMRRKHIRFTEANAQGWLKNNTHATGQCQRALPSIQAFACQVESNHRRRTGRINTEAWPMKIEQV